MDKTFASRSQSRTYSLRSQTWKVLRRHMSWTTCLGQQTYVVLSPMQLHLVLKSFGMFSTLHHRTWILWGQPALGTQVHDRGCWWWKFFDQVAYNGYKVPKIGLGTYLSNEDAVSITFFFCGRGSYSLSFSMA